MSSSNASVKAEGVLFLLGAYKPDEDDTITVLHPSKTFENAGLELVRGDRSWHDKGVTDTPVTLTFSFWEKAPGNMSSMGISGFSSFNAEQREQAKLSLQSWSDVPTSPLAKPATPPRQHQIRPVRQQLARLLCLCV